jgi:predicted membrane protein
MDMLKVLILSVASFAVLFVLTKLMGYRQISEMSFFDYVVGITIGSVAAEMATNIDTQWWRGIIAMAVYALFEILLPWISRKSVRARSFISGKPVVLIKNGQIDKNALKKAHLDINDLLASARGQGYFSLSDIDGAIMETSGKVSFLPTPQMRQLNPKDFNFSPMHTGLCTNLVLDGKIMYSNLKETGIDERKLNKILADRQVRLKDVLLLTVNEAGQTEIYKKS